MSSQVMVDGTRVGFTLCRQGMPCARQTNYLFWQVSARALKSGLTFGETTDNLRITLRVILTEMRKQALPANVDHNGRAFVLSFESACAPALPQNVC